jgi:hypothetical protein
MELKSSSVRLPNFEFKKVWKTSDNLVFFGWAIGRTKQGCRQNELVLTSLDRAAAGPLRKSLWGMI